MGRKSPTVGNIEYKKGKTIEEEHCNFRVYDPCANGLHVFPTKELADNWQDGDETIRVKVNIMDFVAIPASGDGKVRVKRLKVMD